MTEPKGIFTINRGGLRGIFAAAVIDQKKSAAHKPAARSSAAIPRTGSGAFCIRLPRIRFGGRGKKLSLMHVLRRRMALPVYLEIARNSLNNGGISDCNKPSCAAHGGAIEHLRLTFGVVRVRVFSLGTGCSVLSGPHAVPRKAKAASNRSRAVVTLAGVPVAAFGTWAPLEGSEINQLKGEYL